MGSHVARFIFFGVGTWQAVGERVRFVQGRVGLAAHGGDVGRMLSWCTFPPQMGNRCHRRAGHYC